MVARCESKKAAIQRCFQNVYGPLDAGVPAYWLIGISVTKYAIVWGTGCARVLFPFRRIY